MPPRRGFSLLGELKRVQPGYDPTFDYAGEGESPLARSLDPDRRYINLDEQNYLRIALDDPAGFIRGLSEAVTVDEVQRALGLFAEVKRTEDEN